MGKKKKKKQFEKSDFLAWSSTKCQNEKSPRSVRVLLLSPDEACGL